MIHSSIIDIKPDDARRGDSMARTKPSDRIPSLIEAAVRVFAQKGFRRTQMADIAAEMGVSPGLLYSYVESKEALFYLVVDRYEALAEALPSLPAPTPPPGAIAHRVAERFGQEGTMSALSAALARPLADDAASELEAIAREFYGLIYRSARLITILDRSALDMPELAAVFHDRIRGGLVERLSRLIETRMAAGQYRRVAQVAVTARLIIETVTWFACHRRGDPASQDIDDEAAEETTVDFIVNSLVHETASRAGGSRSGNPRVLSKQR
jgi:AcrR family transcriptional regulator